MAFAWVSACCRATGTRSLAVEVCPGCCGTPPVATIVVTVAPPVGPIVVTVAPPAVTLVVRAPPVTALVIRLAPPTAELCLTGVLDEFPPAALDTSVVPGVPWGGSEDSQANMPTTENARKDDKFLFIRDMVDLKLPPPSNDRASQAWHTNGRRTESAQTRSRPRLACVSPQCAQHARHLPAANGG